MPKISSPFVAGFAAVTCALIVGYYLPTFTWPKYDFNALHGVVVLGFPHVQPPQTLLNDFELFDLHRLGFFYNYVLFAVFMSYMYAFMMYPILTMLPGYTAGTFNNMLKGLVFGLMLLFPFAGLIFSKMFDLGFFFANVRTSAITAFYGPQGELNTW
ncbi:MAG: hypothetical protein ACE5KW_01000, partial [Dehalococcoidia bacterium]